MAGETVAFLGMRRSHPERAAALREALLAEVDVVLVGDQAPSRLERPVVAHAPVDDVFDSEKVLAALARALGGRRLDGVVSWSDAPVETTALIEAAHQVPSASRRAARICRDKTRMRSVLSAASPAHCPRFAPVRTLRDAEAAAASMRWPLVLKPATGSGSKGIHQVSDVAQLREAHKALAGLVDPTRDQIFTGHGGEMILEERLRGTEHSVEGVVRDGRICILGVTDKRTSEPHRLETGHLVVRGHHVGDACVEA